MLNDRFKINRSGAAKSHAGILHETSTAADPRPVMNSGDLRPGVYLFFCLSCV